ncbi:C6 finger domain protein [Favolaschia claudopus]|uniref:C6 finger domain protein n=1 Tax=Favolaschia claudopus TaxID=2862362 RepID=A0AAW0DTD2_9AGAR
MSAGATSSSKQPKERVTSKQTSSQFSSRKKSCQKCAEAKARCDLQRPICSRCQGRNISCQWFTVDPPDVPPSIYASIEEACPPLSELGAEELGFSVPSASTSPATVESMRIGSRWLDALIPPPGRLEKKFNPSTIQFISRVLKSYPKILIKDNNILPPIAHALQSQAGPSQLPLSNCRTLLRMWENKAPGSELIARETVWREMTRLFEEHSTYDHVTLLGACQAYLLYSIHLFLCGDADTRSMVDTSTMINLQELSSALSRTGLYTSDAQQRSTVPEWESWIIAEAKRRTLYTMYTFDHVFNYSQGQPSYVGTELGQLSLPASKELWTATTKHDWELKYEQHIMDWPTEGPQLDDLWPHGTEDVKKRRGERADRWVESADEFGMFMFAISNMTFGGS